MKKPTEKWNPVFKTEPVFTPDKVIDIFKKSQIPNFRSKEIREPDVIAERLNEVNRTYHTFKHQNEAPAPGAIRDELKNFLRLSKKYDEALSNLGYAARAQLGLNPECFDSLLYNVQGLQINTESAIASIKTGSKRPKSRSTVIIKLSVIYNEITGRKPGRSYQNGKPGGPFFRFVNECLRHMDPSEAIGSENLKKIIEKALSHRDEYFKRVNPIP